MRNKMCFLSYKLSQIFLLIFLTFANSHLAQAQIHKESINETDAEDNDSEDDHKPGQQGLMNASKLFFAIGKGVIAGFLIFNTARNFLAATLALLSPPTGKGLYFFDQTITAQPIAGSRYQQWFVQRDSRINWAGQIPLSSPAGLSKL